YKIENIKQQQEQSKSLHILLNYSYFSERIGGQDVKLVTLSIYYLLSLTNIKPKAVKKEMRG
ncbi:hypothetical protein ACJX0J_028314, partial [Zea mays]